MSEFEINVVSKEEWKGLAKLSHEHVFGEQFDPEMQRIDFAVIVGDGHKPICYATCKEQDAESVYLQHGGSYPEFRGTYQVSPAFGYMTDFLLGKYKRVSFLVENTNRRMLRLAAKHDYKIFGVRNFKTSVMLEHAKGDC